jgi:hypothetical protein
MVVAGAGLIKRRRSGRLDAADKTGAHARTEHVIDGLSRHRAHRLSNAARDLVGRRMRLGGKDFQNRDPRRGHP